MPVLATGISFLESAQMFYVLRLRSDQAQARNVGVRRTG